MIALLTEAMPVQCQGCAYRPGTEANRSDLTLLTAALCVEARVPFYCHANATDDGSAFTGPPRLCRGHVEALAVRPGDPAAWKVRLAHEALLYLEALTDGSGTVYDPAALTARLVRAAIEGAS